MIYLFVMGVAMLVISLITYICEREWLKGDRG